MWNDATIRKYLSVNGDDVSKVPQIKKLLPESWKNLTTEELLPLLESATKQVNNTVTYQQVLDWWQNKNLSTAADFATITDNFAAIYAYNTAVIEGSKIDYHTTREVFTDGKLSAYSGETRDLFEMQNHKFAYESILKHLELRTPITKELILQLHKTLLYGCYDENRWKKGERPGTYKVHDYCIGEDSIGSFPEDVAADVDDLITEVSGTDGDVLTIAAYLHLQIESIHPFADGNGRLGRLLLNYYLMLHNYPPTVIYNDDKQTYYMALDVWDKTGKLNGFKKFIEEQTVKTWKNRLR